MTDTVMNIPTPLNAVARPRRQDSLGPFAWWGIASLAVSASTFAMVLGVRSLMTHSSDSTLSPLLAVLWFGGMAAPIVVGLKGLLLAGVLWSVLELQQTRASFERCLTAVWVAEVAMALGTLLPAIVGYARGLESAQDLVVPVGLDLFWSPVSPVGNVLARAISIFLLLWAFVVYQVLTDETERFARRPLIVAIVVAMLVIVAIPLIPLL